MTDTTPTINDAAVEAAYECHWRRGPIKDDVQREHWRAILQAAYPHIAAEVRRQMFAELIEAAEGAVMYFQRDDLPGIARSQRVTDWLREQETSK